MLEDLEVVFLNESGSGPGRVMIERTCNMSVEHCNLQCFMRHMRPKHPKPNKMQLFLIPLQNFTKTAEKESKPLRALTCKCIKKTQLRHFYPSWVESHRLWTLGCFDFRCPCRFCACSRSEDLLMLSMQSASSNHNIHTVSDKTSLTRVSTDF